MTLADKIEVDDAIEVMAQGVCCPSGCKMIAEGGCASHAFALEAKAALKAYHKHLSDNGLCIVPVEPTEEMLDAGWRQTGESRAMRSRVHQRFKRYWDAMIAEARK